MKKTVLILLFSCLCCFPMISQNIEENTDSQLTEYKQTNNKDYEILDAKLEACKESFDRINTTYHWSFGIIFTVIATFLGLTGYNYHKNYKSELKKIREELEQEYQKKVEELLQKNSKSISDKTELLEHRLKQDLLQQRYELLSFKFEHEPIEKIKLTLALKILNTLSEANWGYSDWMFNDYMDFIKDCCLKGVYFDHSEVDDVKEMLAMLPERFNTEKEKLQAVINYEK